MTHETCPLCHGSGIVEAQEDKPQLFRDTKTGQLYEMKITGHFPASVRINCPLRTDQTHDSAQ
jgi:hypothetical protein